MALREGDKVVVISGKDKGRESRVARVFPAKGTVIVEGVNTSKRHQRAQGQTMQAGIKATNDVRAEVIELRAANDAPRVVERDETGRIVSIGGRRVQRSADGLVESIG